MKNFLYLVKLKLSSNVIHGSKFIILPEYNVNMSVTTITKNKDNHNLHYSVIVSEGYKILVPKFDTRPAVTGLEMGPLHRLQWSTGTYFMDYKGMKSKVELGSIQN